MTVLLTGIVFDHARGSAGSYTLPLRYSEDVPIYLPEWQRGAPFASVAGYILNRLPHVAFVLARFQASPDDGRVVEIRAKAAAPIGVTRLLPDLPPVTIAVNAAGDSGWCVFPLGTSMLRSAGIDVGVNSWTWELRRSRDDSWIPFDVSHHWVCTVLAPPTAPWMIHPAVAANSSLPWVSVLDVACGWARGASDPIGAASCLTRAVHRLGAGVVSYDAVIGAPHYTVLGAPHFLCMEFLERLQGGEGAGKLVNCSDCAAIVSTFANILGADLWQAKMGLVAPIFRLNPIMAIGSREWSTLWGGFGFHEVAWTGDCSHDDAVFDACLQTDADPDPSTAPHHPSLPTNQLFGAPGSGGYRDQLAAPGDRELCAPQPSLRVRRTVTTQAIGVSPDMPPAPQMVPAVSAPETQPPQGADQHFFDGFFFFGSVLPGWSLSRERAVASAARPPRHARGLGEDSEVTDYSTVRVTWWRSPTSPDRRLRVESIETPSVADAQRIMQRVARDIQCPLLAAWEVPHPGELAMKTPHAEIVMFTRGNLVHVVRDASGSHANVEKEASELDSWLTTAGTTSQAPNEPGARRPAWRRFVLRGTHIRRDARGLAAQADPDAVPMIAQYIVTNP